MSLTRNTIHFVAFLMMSPVASGQSGGTPLKEGKALHRELAAGESHRYLVRAKEGRALNVLVMQRGIDVVVTVSGTDGAKIKNFDSPNGSNGPESVYIPAEIKGPYFLEVKALDPKTPPGAYDIRIRGDVPLDEYRMRDATYDPERFRHMYLNFLFPDGREISLGPTDEFMAQGRLVYVDTKSGRYGLLQPLNDGSFFTSEAMADDFPVAARMAFVEEGRRITGIEWSESGRKKAYGAAVLPSSARDVEITSGEVTLKGVLLTPAGPGPHPAVVYAHGSGPATRHGGFFHSIFLKHGLAVLAFDKRGAGQSGGDWQRASLNDLASDLLAGIDFLKSQLAVDPGRIGIFGISQAGWVASLAASRSPDVKFLIINSGSGVSVAENMVYERESALRQAGLSGSELAQALDFYGRLLSAASDGKPWEEIKAILDGGKGRSWSGHMSIINAGPDNMWWAWLKLNGAVDPIPLLKDVRCPVLWFLANNDRNVPSRASLPRLRKALAGRPGSQVVMMSPAAHVMLESRTGYISDVMMGRGRFVKGFWRRLEDWRTGWRRKLRTRGISGVSGTADGLAVNHCALSPARVRYLYRDEVPPPAPPSSIAPTDVPSLLRDTRHPRAARPASGKRRHERLRHARGRDPAIPAQRRVQWARQKSNFLSISQWLCDCGNDVFAGSRSRMLQGGAQYGLFNTASIWLGVALLAPLLVLGTVEKSFGAEEWISLFNGKDLTGWSQMKP